MKINKEGLNIIKEFEGCILHTYNDGTGVATIGYGHTGKVNNKKLNLNIPIYITKEKAETLLKNDLITFEKAVTSFGKKYKYNFNINEFSALVSFAFNLGVNSLEQVSAHGTRSKSLIAKSMLLYNKANGKIMAGLTRRRYAEQALFLKKLKDIDTVALEVIVGKYGNGLSRKKVLEKMGYNYNEVQDKVNELLKRK